MTPRYGAIGPDGFGVYEADWNDGPHLKRVDGEADAVLLPGFVDLHVHGAAGVDVMDATPTDWRRLLDFFEGQGYEGLLATTVTCTPKECRAVLESLPDHPAVWGLHLEGPFLSERHPGAQPLEKIAAWADSASEWTTVIDHPSIRLVTLAPETPGACELACQLARRQVLVSMGHTDATYEQACEGLRAGVTQATHTFNAMRAMHHREPGAVGFCLATDDIACELIYDRKHVSQPVASVLMRCKPPDKVIAVSDGTRAAGLPQGSRVTMWGRDCEVRGRGVYLAGTDTLAGSAVTLKDCFQNLWDDFGLEAAIRCCALNPRKALGRTGRPKRWLVFGLDGTLLEVRQT